MALRLVTRPSGLLIPVDDLGIKGTLPGQLTLGDDLPFVLALNAGFDGNQSRLLKVDANGNLRVSLAGAAIAGKVSLARASDGTALDITSSADATGNLFGVAVLPQVQVFNGATWDRQRSASAANLVAQSGLGVVLATSPGQWSVQVNSGLGNQSSGTRAAAGAGVRHICTGFTFVISCQAAPAAGNITISLRDGASGAGTVLESFGIGIPAQVFNPIVVSRSGLAIPGSAATAMTLESSAAYAALYVSVNMEGYDAV